MIYIKEYNNYKDIEDICKKYDITDYTINNDESIDVNGDVYLINMSLDKLPLKFNRVTGNFYCRDNQLTSLEGAPKEVGGDFYCHNNQLTSLEGAILDNDEYIKEIIKWQDDYSIWRKDGTLDEYRFKDMMIDIKNDLK